MARGREPQQVARRAMILGAIAFRASLEVTDHPRTAEISRQLLPWLDKLGCANELDPIEHELLATPLGHLSESQRTDANWAGEAAAVFCWMLKLGLPLEPVSPVDQSALLTLLPILKPQASEIIQSASLRDLSEIQDICCQFVLVRSVLQEARIGPPGSDIVRRVNLQRLHEVGVVPAEGSVERAATTIAAMSPEERSRASGLYFVRTHAAMWFLSDRQNYFE